MIRLNDDEQLNAIVSCMTSTDKRFVSILCHYFSEHPTGRLTKWCFELDEGTCCLIGTIYKHHNGCAPSRASDVSRWIGISDHTYKWLVEQNDTSQYDGGLPVSAACETEEQRIKRYDEMRELCFELKKRIGGGE